VVASAIGGLATRGYFHRAMTASGIAMIACVVAMVCAASISFTPKLSRARMILGQVALAAFLSVPLVLLAAYGSAELGIRLLQQWVARVGPRLEEIRAARGEYPREVDWPFDERAHYESDGTSYSVTWVDGMTCGRVVHYRSSTRAWVETNDPCYF
jgi:hypothetical protein